VLNYILTRVCTLSNLSQEGASVVNLPLLTLNYENNG